MKWLFVSLAVVVASLLASLYTAEARSAEELSIHCLYVGRGDCTLIVSPSGKTMMVDTGDDAEIHNEHVCRYLDSLNVSHLNYLVITHYHADHIGGVDSLLKHGVTIDTVYDRGEYYCSDPCTLVYIPAVTTPPHDIRHTLADSQIIDLGDNVTATVVSVNGNGEHSTPPFVDHDCSATGYHENDFSVAMVVTLRNFSFFVGGDLSGSNTSPYTDIESSVAEEVSEIDVYQVNHHGSKYSSSQDFLDSLNPTVSIVSSHDGQYHPHPEALIRLLSTSVVYQTKDSLGTRDIVIETDGLDSFYVQSEGYGLRGFPVPVLDDEEALELLPNTFELSQNYPNPFNPQTTIEFDLPERCDIKLSVLNVTGQLVKSLLDRNMPAGRASCVWDGTDQYGSPVASGVYFCLLIAGQNRAALKMLLLR